MYQQNERYNRGREGNDAAPVNVGDEIEVKIEAVGEKGDGIAKKNGFVIFVPGAKEGTNVKIKITRVLKKMAFSELLGQGQANSNEESEEQTEAAPEEPEEDFSGEDSDDFGEGDKEEEKEEEKFE